MTENTRTHKRVWARREGRQSESDEGKLVTHKIWWIILAFWNLKRASECMEFYINSNLSFLALAHNVRAATEREKNWTPKENKPIMIQSDQTIFRCAFPFGLSSLMDVDTFSHLCRCVCVVKVIVEWVTQRRWRIEKNSRIEWMMTKSRASSHHNSIIIDWHFANEQQTRLYFNRFFAAPKTQDVARKQCFFGQIFEWQTKPMEPYLIYYILENHYKFR